MSLSFKKRWFEKDIILQSVRWYVAYPLSYRQIEEMMRERGIEVDHSTLNRWVVKYSPELEKEFRKIWRASIGGTCLQRSQEKAINLRGVATSLVNAPMARNFVFF